MFRDYHLYHKEEAIMKKFILIFCAMLITGAFFSSSIDAADWRFPVGLTYIDNIGEVVDLYVDNLEAEGYEVETSYEGSVGISFNPYVQLDNGIRIGTGIGPIAVIAGDADYFDFPVQLNGGYVFLPKSNISPYIRGGAMYHIAGGDYVEGSTPGLFGGVGIEFFRNKPVGFGIEVGYDSSEVEFEKNRCTNVSRRTGNCLNYVKEDETEDIKPIGLMISIFAVF
jgi:hypothetical protein